jgi:autotransporter-associated beta strand protein
MGSKFGSGRAAYMMSAAVGALLLSAGAGQATTVVATAPADVTSAINNANSGQSIILDVGSGVNIDLSATSLATYAPASGGTLNLGDGSLNGFAGALSGGTLTFNQPLSVNLAHAGGVNGTIQTSLAGSGSLTVNGANNPGLFYIVPTLILSGTNTYTGGTIVGPGVGALAQVEFLNSGAVPTSGKITGVAGAGYAIDQNFINAFKTSVSSPNTAALATDSSNNLDFSNTGGEVALGAIRVNADYSGTLTAVNNSNPGGGYYAIGGGNGILTISSNLVDGAGHNQLDIYSGYTILSGTNTFSGGIQIESGTLRIASPSALPSTGSISFVDNGYAGGTFALGYAFDQTLLARINGFNAVGTVALAADNSNNLNFTSLKTVSLGVEGAATYSGVLTPGANGYFLGGGTGILTVSSQLTGANALTYNEALLTDTAPDGSGRGPATVILTNPNDNYTGDTTITYGKLQLGNGVANGLLTGTSGVNDAPVFSNNIGLNVSILAFNEATGVSFAAPISSGVAVEQDGPGTVTLTGTNTYTGLTYINAGALAAGGAGALSADSSVLIAFGATLDISAGGNQTVKGLVGPSGGTVNLGANSLTLSFASGSANTTYGFYQTSSFGQPLFTQAGAASGLPATTFGDDFAGVIQGSGQVIIGTTTSTATPVFSGLNTYTGGTVLQGGSLALGDSANIGAVGSGAVSGNGYLEFTEPSPVTFANAIGGSVKIEQSGPGKVILTGNVTTTGFILIDNTSGHGVLQLGDGVATTGLGSGHVSDGGTLRFDEGGAITIANQINNNAGLLGAVTQAGPGAVTLNAVNTYLGLTDVQSGMLVIGDASTPTAEIAGDAHVEAAGILAGYGKIDGNVNNIGVVEPGDDVGTLTIGGSYTQTSGGDLLIAVTPAAASLLKVSGTASLAGTVTFAYAPGSYSPTAYTFLQSSSLGGTTFSTVAASLADPLPSGFTQTVTYTAGNAILNLGAASPTPTPPPPTPTPPPPTPTPPPPTPTPPPPTPTPPPPTPTPPPPTPTPPPPTPTPPPPTPTPPPPTPTPPPPTPTPTPVVVAPADTRIFSAQAFTFQEANRAALVGLLNRTRPDGGGNTMVNLTPAAGEPARTWAQVDASTETASTNGYGAGFHGDTSGLSGGGDVDVGRGDRLGVALGYDRDTLHDKAAGSASADAFRASLYASQAVGAVGFSEAVSYATAWTHVDRASGAGMATSSYRSQEWSAAVQVASPFETGDVRVTPAAGVVFSHLTSSAFSETDLVSAAFAVKGAGQALDTATPYVNVGLSKDFVDAGGVTYTPDVQIGYRYEGGAHGQAFTLTAADTTVFRGNRVGLDGGGALLGLSLTAHKGQWSAFARYRAQVSGDWSDQGGSAGFRMAF